MTIYDVYSVMNTPVNAIPDLSENQVLTFTEWMGRNPQIIEDQMPGKFFTNAEEAGNMVVSSNNDQLVYLKLVAHV